MSTGPRRASRPERRSRARPLPALLLAAVLAIAPATAASAQDERDDDRDVQLTVTALDGVLGPGSVRMSPDAPERQPEDLDSFDTRLLIENLTDDELDSLTAIVEVYPAISSRAELRQAFDGQFRDDPVHVRGYDVAVDTPLQPGELAGVETHSDAEDIPWTDEAGGVYPVRLAVTRGVEVLDEAITAVVWLQELPSEPLLTSLVWPFDGPPWRTTRGAYAQGADHELDPGGRLDVLLSALEDARSDPVVLAPAAHLLEDLSDRADGFTALERAPNSELVSRRVPVDASEPSLATATLTRLRELASTLTAPPITGAYADADLNALIDGGPQLRELAAVATADGRRRVEMQLGVDVDPATHLIREPVDERILDLLPGDQVMLAASAVEATDPTDGPGGTVNRLRAPSGRLLNSLVADADLASSLAQTDHPAGPIIGAQRPIAESAAAYLTGSDRALVALPPASWDPSPEVAERLIEGFRSASWLELTPPADVLSRVPATAGSGVELRSPPMGGLDDGLAERIAEADRDLDAAAAALPDEVDQVGGRSVGDLELAVLRSTSMWYQRSERNEAEALLRDVERAVDATFGEIEVIGGDITLTSDTGQIPITLQRERGGPITVHVELDSPGTLRWPEGRRVEGIVLGSDESQTVTFTTEARSTGTFPVTVRVSDPSGQRQLDAATIAVRSTALSGPALYTIAAIVLALLVIGLLRRGPRRRGRSSSPSDPTPRRPLEVVDHRNQPPGADRDDRPPSE